jgi:hypothetical protein
VACSLNFVRFMENPPSGHSYNCRRYSGTPRLDLDGRPAASQRSSIPASKSLPAKGVQERGSSLPVVPAGKAARFPAADVQFA